MYTHARAQTHTHTDTHTHTHIHTHSLTHIHVHFDALATHVLSTTYMHKVHKRVQSNTSVVTYTFTGALRRTHIQACALTHALTNTWTYMYRCIHDIEFTLTYKNIHARAYIHLVYRHTYAHARVHTHSLPEKYKTKANTKNTSISSSTL